MRVVILIITLTYDIIKKMVIRGEIKNMLMLILIILGVLRIISIPLIIFVGESNIDERNKTIALLLLTFLYNNFMGVIFKILWIFMSTPIGVLFIVIGVICFLSFLISINLYIKGKIDITRTLYIILIVIAFLIGILFK